MVSFAREIFISYPLMDATNAGEQADEKKSTARSDQDGSGKILGSTPPVDR